MSSSLEKEEKLLEEIKGVFIQFIYDGVINSVKNQPESFMYFKVDEFLKKFGYYKLVYKDISDAIMKTEITQTDTASLMDLYHLSFLGLGKFISDIQKRFRVPLNFSVPNSDLSFMTLHNLILESRKKQNK